MDIKKKHYPLLLTLVLVKDEASGGYTSYFEELDNIIAEGETEEEATENLRKLVHSVFKYLKEEKHETTT